MEHVEIKIEDFMDVVYQCKFCSFSCTYSPDMSVHVRDKHLSLSHCQETGLPASSNLRFMKGETVPKSARNITSAISSNTNTFTISNSLNTSAPSSSGSSSTNFIIHESNEILGYTSDSQPYLDKGLGPVSLTPVSVPSTQSGPITLSNSSTPDLTELINLVKPSENRCRGSSINNAGSNLFTSNTETCHFVTTSCSHLSASGNHMTSADDQVTMASVVQLQSEQTFTSAEVVAGELDGLGISQPYTVMAIHLPGIAAGGSNGVSQYVVSTPASESINIPESTETKEFLLCGLCKLAFTTMEECQVHMQSEHKELMQGSGVSIGVQAGGAKRGRKRKTDEVKMKEIVLDAEDLEWLPSVTDNNRTSHPDGRVRRRVKPPRALKEDFVLGKRLKKRIRESCSSLGYKLSCPMMSCKGKFKTEMGLHVHMSCHNIDDTAFTCKECQVPYYFWKQLRMHLWREHRVDSDLFSCEKCDYKTDTHHKMTIHKEIHTDTKPYTCDVCGKGFRQASQMKNHQVTHVVQEGKDARKGWFSSKTCDICDRSFANSKCLKNHKAAVHSSYKPYECMYCNHTTARKAMMELHIRIHTGEKPFKCDICTYSTGDHNSMRRHKMRHTGQKQYKCTQCTYTCIQSISLKQHMRHKHPGTSAGIFQCSRCPFRTINQEIYNNHMQDHKKGLIPDKLIPQRLELPKAKRVSRRSQAGSGKRQAAGQNIENLLMKHPQFHAVLPGEEPTTLSSVSGDTLTGGSSEAEVFNMQVTMLPDGDTQISADDMNRLSESPALIATGVSPLQLIYATLSTISEQEEVAKMGEGRTALLTAELIGGIHTAVISSAQDGVTLHSVTYHIPKVPETNGEDDNYVKVKPAELVSKENDELVNLSKDENLESKEAREIAVGNEVPKMETLDTKMSQVVLKESSIAENEGNKSEEIFFSGEPENKSENTLVIGDKSIIQDSPIKLECVNRVEKFLLREMLESKEKASDTNTQKRMVNFITVGFLDHSVAKIPTSNMTVKASNQSESEDV